MAGLKDCILFLLLRCYLFVFKRKSVTFDTIEQITSYPKIHALSPLLGL